MSIIHRNEFGEVRYQPEVDGKLRWRLRSYATMGMPDEYAWSAEKPMEPATTFWADLHRSRRKAERIERRHSKRLMERRRNTWEPDSDDFDVRVIVDGFDITQLPTRDIDTAHAVALERERIAGWLERGAPGLRVHALEIGVETPGERLARAIRNGEHWRDA